MHCDEAREQLGALHLGRLPKTTADAVCTHLADCTDCRRTADEQFAGFWDALPRPFPPRLDAPPPGQHPEEDELWELAARGDCPAVPTDGQSGGQELPALIRGSEVRPADPRWEHVVHCDTCFAAWARMRTTVQEVEGEPPSWAVERFTNVLERFQRARLVVVLAWTELGLALRTTARAERAAARGAVGVWTVSRSFPSFDLVMTVKGEERLHAWRVELRFLPTTPEIAPEALRAYLYAGAEGEDLIEGPFEGPIVSFSPLEPRIYRLEVWHRRPGTRDEIPVGSTLLQPGSVDGSREGSGHLGADQAVSDGDPP
jgi:putative zinc finger protein